MEKKKKEIVDFVKERDFGELIGAPFYFIIQEFKPFARSLLRYAGPWMAIALLGMALLSNSIWQAVDMGTEPSGVFVIYSLLMILFLMIGFLAAVTTTHSYITLYVRNGKDNFTIEEVGELVKRNVFKIFGAGILVYLMVVVGFLFFYIPGIYLAVALSFFTITIVYEDISGGASIGRSFEVVKGHWWQTLGVMFVFAMIIGFASYIFIIPIYVVIFAAAIGGTSVGTGSVIVIILSVALYFTAYIFFMAMQQVLVAFQYFNIMTKKEGLGLFDRIDAINKDEDMAEEDDVNIYEIKEEEKEPNKTSEEIKDKEEQAKEKEDNRFSDSEEKNRFKDDKDDDIDRFKPKF